MDSRFQALQKIRDVVGEKGWIDDPAAMAPYLEEWRGRWHGVAPAIVSPGSTRQVAEVVGICAAAGIAMVPQAGNTSLCGGSVPDETGRELVISVDRLTAVRNVDPINDTMTVEAGLLLADAQIAASEVDRLFPLSLASEGSCRIGGNLSTNAGGVHVLRYGNMRDLVLGLEVVLPDGRIWEGLRRLRKDNTGYDLKQLFIGAEGTLGLITAAVLRLFPRPRERWVAMVAVPDVDAALALLGRARQLAAEQVTSFELIPRRALEFVLTHIPGTANPFAKFYDNYVLIELNSSMPGDRTLSSIGEALLARATESSMVYDAVVAGSDRQIDALWKLRESISEAQKGAGASVKHDVAVPIAAVGEFLQEATRRVEAEWPGVRVCAFGHLGDGNIHFNLSVPEGEPDAPFLDHWEAFSRVVHDVVVSLDGSIAAEHGVGRLKREELAHYKSDVEMDLMRRIKAVMDPSGLMNPGRIL